jgi:hypothetical protein
VRRNLTLHVTAAEAGQPNVEQDAVGPMFIDPP